MVEWDESFDLNITEIDKQHRMLVSMVNNLYTAKQFERGKEELAKLLNRMSVYAAFHFAKEEDLLESFGYPQVEDHIQEHSDFEKKVFDFENDFAEGKKDLTSKVMTFLGDWLVDHIKESDRQGARFLTQRGVK